MWLQNDHCLHPVASYTGAWIETPKASDDNGNNEVASYTGAWIETRIKKHGNV